MKVLFIHRSVGQNLLNDGNVRELIKESNHNIEFSDYNQNIDTLTDATGERKNLDLKFPYNDTKPAAFAQIFATEPEPSHRVIRDFALDYDVVVVKSCYPNSNISSDEQLNEIKGYYRSIAEFFAERPGQKLVIFTSPPLTPIMTRPGKARRARALADWLATQQFADNVTVFNFFDLLADPKHHWLKRSYRRLLPVDSHPNARASKDIAPNFVALLSEL